MKPHLIKRIERLQAEMTTSGLDAIVLADRENLIYFAGTTEIECMAAVIPAKGAPILCCLWLDAPYVKERSAAANIKAYRFPESTIGQTIVSAMRELELDKATVGFAKYFVEFAVFDAISSAFPGLDFRPASEILYRTRAVKDEGERALMQKACGFLAAGMDAAVAAVRPGVSEVAVLAEADYAMRKAGSEGSTFRMQVLTPAKQLLAHPYAGDVAIEADQAIVIHLGASCQGYCAKMSRTVALGAPARETCQIYDVLRQAQERAVAALRPGTPVSEIYDLVEAAVAESGYGGMILDHVGYGVGIRQSEFYPILGKGLPHLLAENMVVDLLLPTILKRGVGGPRITDVIRVTGEGGVYMTTYPRELIRKDADV